MLLLLAFFIYLIYLFGSLFIIAGIFSLIFSSLLRKLNPIDASLSVLTSKMIFYV